MTGSLENGGFDMLPLAGGGALLLSSHPAGFVGLEPREVVTLYVEQGTKLLLSVLTQQELLSLKLGDLGDICHAQGVQWMHSPIKDFKTPDASFEAWWAENRVVLHDCLNGGHTLAMHCWAGCGRSGTIAARLLVERGFTPADAIEVVRSHRLGAIESKAQEHYVLSLKNAL
jgi:protein-tyrosine phosphatase